MKIGIIFGGKSFEHDISIVTAYQLKKKLAKDYNIHLIYVNINGDFYNADKLMIEDFKNEKYKKLRKLKLKKLQLDCLVGAMHGENGEDGLAYDFARINKIKYLGANNFCGSLALSKLKTHQFLKNNGIKMLDYYPYTYNDYLNGITIQNYPIIVKPDCGGSSLGIKVIKSKEEFEKKINEAFKYSKILVVEPFYENILEYNLALNEKSYSCLERINKKDDIFSFENKYQDSFKLMHQNIEDSILYEEFCKIGRDVYNLISASGIIRIDFFLLNNHIYVNEVNTTPGALAMYLFSDFERVFKESLELALKKEDKTYFKNDFLIKNDIKK